MAPLYQHMQDCQRFLGASHENVNRWIDEFSAIVGPQHRKFRHHWEGVQEAEKLFGKDGARAAIVHILRDCRNIPRSKDYEEGTADALGLKSEWPVSAYIQYSEEAFSTLVKYTLDGPSAVVLWAFFRAESDVANLLAGLSRLTTEQQSEYLKNWPTVLARYAEMSENAIPAASFSEAEGAVREYFEEAKVALSGLFAQVPDARLVMVPVDQLIMPLTLIDYEYVEQLKATLRGTEPRDIAAFAVPVQLHVRSKGVLDASGRAVTFMSAEKTLAVSNLMVTEIPGVGFEVKALLAGTPQMIFVSHVGDRFYLVNGVHRAYLLASLGIKEIPCVLRKDNSLPVITGIYPSFAPHVLALPRPPLLMDSFDPSLTLHIPIIRTTKMIRISTEEVMLPID